MKPWLLAIAAALCLITLPWAAFAEPPMPLTPAADNPAAHLGEPTAAKIAAGLAAHRAFYKLTLDTSHGGDVIAATGTMSYEVMDACDGWAVQQRLDMTITNRDGQDVRMVSDYATWESKDGLRMRFRMRQTTDAATTEVTSGEASVDHPGGAGEVRYSLPKVNVQKLPAGTLFPMWHTATIIAAAEQGKKVLALPLFDGTGDTGAQDTSVVITSWHKPEPFRFAPLAALPSGTVHVAFFDRTPDASEPDYEVGMHYWENGVADQLNMDFGDFVMQGKLDQFKLAPPHHC
ncbi:MAG: cell envelope integrity EipB family protein [Acidibrevibacterium sp.]|uniref:cell envelope integrity EipB family protein n=1 Tax=Acidibrevibacterium sp. TaxID=2606776 RepID=UPI003D081408